jgi:hypothetical protein
MPLKQESRSQLAQVFLGIEDECSAAATRRCLVCERLLNG